MHYMGYMYIHFPHTQSLDISEGFIIIASPYYVAIFFSWIRFIAITFH